jgi:hypothetical protein
MHGWQSLNLELTPLDPDVERNANMEKHKEY